MKIIYSKNAPDPIGPYSQAVLVNGLLYVSGQVAIDSKTQDLMTGSIETETTKVMENIDAIFTDPLISIYVPGVQDSRYYANNGDLFFDIRAQYRFNKDWKAQIGILNLMNRLSSPRPALLSKPRSFMFQISYELN